MSQIAVNSVTFSKRDCSGNGQLILEHSHQQRRGRRVIDYVRLFPAVPAQMDTIGNASVSFVRTEAMERQDLLTLSGGDRVSLNTPRRWVDPCNSDGLGAGGPWQGYGQLLTAGGVSIKSHWSRDVKVGISASPTIHYDADNNQLVLNMPVYGKYEVKYQAGYNLYKITRSGDSAKRDVTLSAFFRGVSAEIGLSGLSLLDRIPLYYVTSDYISDENGTWELPDNWPDENTYEDAIAADPLPDNGSYQQLRRVHEAAYLTYLGAVKIDDRLCATCNWLQPFEAGGDVFYVSYERDFTFRQQPRPSEASDAYDFIRWWEDIDFEDLYESAKNRFPGLKKEGMKEE